MKRLGIFFIVQFIIIFVVGLIANWLLDAPQNMLVLACIAFGAAIPITFAARKLLDPASKS